MSARVRVAALHSPNETASHPANHAVYKQSMRGWLLSGIVALAISPVWAASDLTGRVTTGNVPVPGTTVIAVRGDRRLTTVMIHQGFIAS